MLKKKIKPTEDYNKHFNSEVDTERSLQRIILEIQKMIIDRRKEYFYQPSKGKRETKWFLSEMREGFDQQYLQSSTIINMNNWELFIALMIIL